MGVSQITIILLACCTMANSKQELQINDERHRSYTDKTEFHNPEQISDIISSAETRKIILENNLFNHTIYGQGNFILLYLRYSVYKTRISLYIQ